MQERGWGCRTARGAILRGSYEQAETAELKPWLGALQQAGIGCGRGTVPGLDQLMEPGLRAVGQDGKGLVCVCVYVYMCTGKASFLGFPWQATEMALSLLFIIIHLTNGSTEMTDLSKGEPVIGHEHRHLPCWKLHHLPGARGAAPEQLPLTSLHCLPPSVILE